MEDNSDLTWDSLLPVKEAALRTNRSVPTFYTEKRKKDFGFYEKGEEETWLISVRDLVKQRFLTPNTFEPTKGRRLYSSLEENDEVSQSLLDANATDLRQEVELLLAENKRLREQIEEERARHLEIINSLVSSFGKGASGEAIN